MSDHIQKRGFKIIPVQTQSWPAATEEHLGVKGLAQGEHSGLDEEGDKCCFFTYPTQIYLAGLDLQPLLQQKQSLGTWYAQILLRL